jgi:hypothetical protein
MVGPGGWAMPGSVAGEAVDSIGRALLAWDSATDGSAAGCSLPRHALNRHATYAITHYLAGGT